MKFKPTAAQLKIIKEAASRESSPHIPVGAILLEPGIRFNTEKTTVPHCHMNIAFVTEQPNDGWNDTDLDDYGMWSEFTKGVELTDDGRGIFDFYIRRRGVDGDLCGNITVNVVNGKLWYIDGYGKPGSIWMKDGGFNDPAR
jgi:hypothetical protein